MANLVSKGFILTFNTNLHAGSGDANYGIIDKLVQREPSTNRPIIHSSSLKGALREYFEQPKLYPFDEVKKTTDPFIKEVFGSHQNDEKMETGKCRFLAAYLLSIPVRSNVIPYFMATSVDVLKELKQESESTGYSLSPELVKEIDAVIGLFQNKENEGGPFVFTDKLGQNVILEDWPATPKSGMEVTELEAKACNPGIHLAVFNTSHFKSLCDQLPVIARNQLENGISKNLWYEEVVPRFSRFFQFTLVPVDDNKSINSFVGDLTNTTNTFQIGANATIGYGYCKFIKL